MSIFRQNQQGKEMEPATDRHTNREGEFFNRAVSSHANEVIRSESVCVLSERGSQVAGRGRKPRRGDRGAADGKGRNSGARLAGAVAGVAGDCHSDDRVAAEVRDGTPAAGGRARSPFRLLRPVIQQADGTYLVTLTRGKFAVIDACDVEMVSRSNWYASLHRGDRWYARTKPRPNVSLYLHRAILGVLDNGLEVDHIDGDGLNCRRRNMRACTHAQNRWNTRGRRKLKGVYPSLAKWKCHFRNKYIGTFDTEEAAARAYDAAATKQFGEFARLNFPEHYQPGQTVGATQEPHGRAIFLQVGAGASLLRTQHAPAPFLVTINGANACIS